MPSRGQMIVTIRLQPHVNKRLRTAAATLGFGPSTLARLLVERGLSSMTEDLRKYNNRWRSRHKAG